MRVRYLEIERLRGKETQVIGDSDIQGEEIQRHRDSGGASEIQRLEG